MHVKLRPLVLFIGIHLVYGTERSGFSCIAASLHCFIREEMFWVKLVRKQWSVFTSIRTGLSELKSMPFVGLTRHTLRLLSWPFVWKCAFLNVLPFVLTSPLIIKCPVSRCKLCSWFSKTPNNKTKAALRAWLPSVNASLQPLRATVNLKDEGRACVGRVCYRRPDGVKVSVGSCATHQRDTH